MEKLALIADSTREVRKRMNIDSKVLKDWFFKEKQETTALWNRATTNRVKDALDAYLQLTDKLLLWLDKSEKQGEIKMEDLELGTGKTVKISDISHKRSQVDPAIIKVANRVTVGYAEEVDSKKIKWPHYRNRVYALKREGLIPADSSPMREGETFYLGRTGRSKKG